MRCEMRENPAGIDTDTPRLSWELHSDERSVHQTGYRILVASSEELLARNRADKWDSGWVSSDESVGIDYAGAPLATPCCRAARRSSVPVATTPCDPCRCVPVQILHLKNS